MSPAMHANFNACDAFARPTRGLGAPSSNRRKAVRRTASMLTWEMPHLHGFGCRENRGMKADTNFLLSNFLPSKYFLIKSAVWLYRT